MFTGDSAVASIALVSALEEACHILGQHLMLVVVLDEAVVIEPPNLYKIKYGCSC